ncbi:acyl-ACP thioesterase [Celeribacter litoreus]|uniref:acyl-ACP thioesterase n=1 Tax=Celeribacter litoreus TaxID=2876714 RepID=UPI001CCBEAE1|nr:acyl-ACP thioesterase [Celeribacter litoreus]MCA0043370.1 acyl-ACP thioesterase [Celeribacter litoreus]
MSAPMTTLHGFVPAWEIDANDHWNTAFYLRSFQYASERFAEEAGLPASPPQVLHTRFFRELRHQKTFTVESHRIDTAQSGYDALHLMRDQTTGKVAAASLEMRAGLPPVIEEFDATNYAPRSLPVGPDTPVDATEMLRDGRATVSHAGVLRPDDFDAEGRLLSHAIHMRVSEGNSHLWHHVDVTPDDFYGRGLGRAIVEHKLSRHGAAKPGMAIRQVSYFDNFGGKSVGLTHQVEDLTTGAVLSIIRTTTLVLDLKARKSVALPDDLIQRLNRA